MVLTMVPSMITNEMDIETKIIPIQRFREVATILNSLEGKVPLVSISARASQYATRRLRELRAEDVNASGFLSP
jgi:hypothetical protein